MALFYVEWGMVLALLAPPPVSEGRRVLVVATDADPASVGLARYYAERRRVPKENVLLLHVKAAEGVAQAEFEKGIKAPVRAALAASKNPIDFLLFVRGVPIRVDEGGYSVDSLVMSADVPVQRGPVGGAVAEIAPNPYFGQKGPFSRAKFGFPLACRLDGYTVEDARALVDHSLASKANKGPFLLDEADNRRSQSYGDLQATLGRAATALRAKGLDAVLDEEKTFASSAKPLAGYASWGSNDGAYQAGVYHALRFLPGAICETFVSTSGRTFRPAKGGQSLVADLVAQGVTGVKGYVSEPYTLALAKADILFDRYTSGRNLAESFYAASPVTHWKDVVIGDPLCAPYRK